MAMAIRRELPNCATLRAEMREEIRQPERNPRVLGSITHDFYNCCERLFRRVSTQVNGSSYPGDVWEKELLFRMTVAVPGVRPRVISEELAAELDEYLSFRHVFRNIYGFELKGDRLARLSERLDGVAERFEQEIARFLASLDDEVEDTADP